MIYVVCGLIGSGKSTWCEMQSGYVTDFDIIQNKAGQIAETLRLDAEGKTVYHITCYPTDEELWLLQGKVEEFIWINTSENRCCRNIRARGRVRDIANMCETRQKNKELLARYMDSSIPFKLVDIFEQITEERW